ncbi:MAG: GTP-binding protein [Lachnospiraceae bacterium]|nr:GTP-binding protein [Lachnospiraceae bacterium]
MKDLLKFITCGSVDDGKSTLIGHILYDSKLLYADQEKALELDSKVGSRGGAIDYSLLLDGLTEEREQGITIDVAYRYFTTDARSFIVADTPGHEEYTRNMACGASFADLAVIMVDAEHGVLVQTRRHARICAMMGIRYFVFAVNKMDLVDYSKDRFREIESQINDLKNELSLENTILIPVSATEGDNVTRRSEKMPWYTGPVLLSYLENVDIDEGGKESGFYLPVQRVCRPTHEFRGFQGQIEAGSVKVGDELTSLPSGEKAHVKEILAPEMSVSEAGKGQPVTITLDREIDVSRGSVLAKDADLKVADTIMVELLWMDDAPLENGKNFWIKVGTHELPCLVTEIRYAIDVNTGEHKKASVLHKNEIAVCRISFTDRAVIDTFENHRTLGEFILIDRISFQTSACGVIEKVHQGNGITDGNVTASLRAMLEGQRPVAVEFYEGISGITRDKIASIEKALVTSGRHTYLYAPREGEDVETVVKHLLRAGIIVLVDLPASVNGRKVLNEDEPTVYVYNKPTEESVDDIVAYIRRITDVSTRVSGEGDYI